MSTDLNDDGTTDVADLDQAILRDAVEGIESVSVDGMNVNQQSLRDRMMVSDRAKNRTASSLSGWGFRNRKLVSHGSD